MQGENMQAECETRRGVMYALGAYIIWGFSPIYFKAVSVVPPLEIVGHRVVWSVFFLALLLQYTKCWRDVGVLLRQRRTCLILCCTSLLIVSNWLVFIWAVTSNHMLDASLGYYINPLVNVLLGMIFFRERLSFLQWLAVGLAAAGVAVQLVRFGSLPWVALILAFSFGFYGLLRKKIVIDTGIGLFFETALLLPVALAYLLFAAKGGTGVEEHSVMLNVLLIAAGLVTTVPLFCFTAAAARLRLSTLGFFQYIAPSLMFLLALAVYGEPFRLDSGITFAFIWSALAVFTYDAFCRSRRVRRL